MHPIVLLVLSFKMSTELILALIAVAPEHIGESFTVYLINCYVFKHMKEILCHTAVIHMMLLNLVTDSQCTLPARNCMPCI